MDTTTNPIAPTATVDPVGSDPSPAGGIVPLTWREAADGCADLLGHLAAQEIPVAILTRNVREVVDTFARAFAFRFHAVFTREDGPPKPSPAGALALCKSMGVAPAETLAVGDYKFDVMAGRGAGCRTVLVTREAMTAAELVDWGSPDLVIQSLRELLPLFR